MAEADWAFEEGETTRVPLDWLFVFSCAVFNLIRIPKLRAQSA